MERSRSLVGVLLVIVGLLAGDAAAQHWLEARSNNNNHIVPPALLPQKQAVVPRDDKCNVEHDEMIQCGSPDITREQCEVINCCHDGQQCYYGKAGSETFCCYVCDFFFFFLISKVNGLA